jgi:hypothetical protein
VICEDFMEKRMTVAEAESADTLPVNSKQVWITETLKNRPSASLDST